jgi:hypothetical protein
MPKEFVNLRNGPIARWIKVWLFGFLTKFARDHAAA